MAGSADKTAFTEFARRMEPRLRYALAGCLQADQARDATQEALVYGGTNRIRPSTWDLGLSPQSV